MNEYESMLPSAGPEAKQIPLRLLEDIFHNRIMQKKQEMYQTQLITDLISRYRSYC